MKKYTKNLVRLCSKNALFKCFVLSSVVYLFVFYFSLGKLVFAEPVPKDNEAATWREKLDQLYKSSSQSFRVVVHGSKVCHAPLLFFLFTFSKVYCRRQLL